MSCERMENRILGYVDGRLKQNEQLELEKHFAECVACRLRVNEFRMVSGLLDELPVIEPSAAFDVRVRALVAAEPAKQSWWAWFTPSPRVAFAASMLLLATVWIGMRPPQSPLTVADQNELTVLENYDVLSNFAPLTELPQPVQADDESQPQNENPQQDAGQANQTM